MDNNSLMVINPYESLQNFEAAQRMCGALASSNCVPDVFRVDVCGKAAISNCMIALELSARLGFSPFMTMQNLYIVHGKPCFSSSFMIAALNKTGRFSPLKYKKRYDAKGAIFGCRAYATERASGETLEGAEITLAMAQAEGWSTKAGSKWRTMPEQMLYYRSATSFIRLYAPDVLMGLPEVTELRDAEAVRAVEQKTDATAIDDLNALGTPQNQNATAKTVEAEIVQEEAKPKRGRPRKAQPVQADQNTAEPPSTRQNAPQTGNSMAGKETIPNEEQAPNSDVFSDDVSEQNQNSENVTQDTESNSATGAEQQSNNAYDGRIKWEMM